MRTIGNILWLVLAGLWLAIAYVIAGVVMCILIITIPFGIQAFKLAGFTLWPFGRTVVPNPDASPVLGCLGNLVWIVLVGWELAVVHLVAGVMLCLTIIGIPLGPRLLQADPARPPAVRAGGGADRRGPAGGEGGLRAAAEPRRAAGGLNGQPGVGATPSRGITRADACTPLSTVNHSARWSSDSSTSSSTSSFWAMPGPYSMIARWGRPSRAWAKAVPGSICCSTAAQ